LFEGATIPLVLFAEVLLGEELLDGRSFFLAAALFDALSFFLETLALFEGLFEARLGEFEGDLAATGGFF
jgi:hypothetical protein